MQAAGRNRAIGFLYLNLEESGEWLAAVLLCQARRDDLGRRYECRTVDEKTGGMMPPCPSCAHAACAGYRPSDSDVMLAFIALGILCVRPDHLSATTGIFVTRSWPTMRHIFLPPSRTWADARSLRPAVFGGDGHHLGRVDRCSRSTIPPEGWRGVGRRAPFNDIHSLGRKRYTSSRRTRIQPALSCLCPSRDATTVSPLRMRADITKTSGARER